MQTDCLFKSIPVNRNYSTLVYKMMYLLQKQLELILKSKEENMCQKKGKEFVFHIPKLSEFISVFSLFYTQIQELEKLSLYNPRFSFALNELACILILNKKGLKEEKTQNRENISALFSDSNSPDPNAFVFQKKNVSFEVHQDNFPEVKNLSWENVNNENHNNPFSIFNTNLQNCEQKEIKIGNQNTDKNYNDNLNFNFNFNFKNNHSLSQNDKITYNTKVNNSKKMQAFQMPNFNTRKTKIQKRFRIHKDQNSSQIIDEKNDIKGIIPINRKVLSNCK